MYFLYLIGFALAFFGVGVLLGIASLQKSPEKTLDVRFQAAFQSLTIGNQILLVKKERGTFKLRPVSLTMVAYSRNKKAVSLTWCENGKSISYRFVLYVDRAPSTQFFPLLGTIEETVELIKEWIPHEIFILSKDIMLAEETKLIPDKPAGNDSWKVFYSCFQNLKKEDVILWVLSSEPYQLKPVSLQSVHYSVDRRHCGIITSENKEIRSFSALEKYMHLDVIRWFPVVQNDIPGTVSLVQSLFPSEVILLASEKEESKGETPADDPK